MTDKRVFTIVDSHHTQGELILLNEDGMTTREGNLAHVLSAIAFANGATEVKHDYDIAAYERRQNVKA